MYCTAGEELVDAVTVIGEATVAFGVGVQTVTAVVLVGVQLACALAELGTIMVNSTTKTNRAKSRVKRNLALREPTIPHCREAGWLPLRPVLLDRIPVRRKSRKGRSISGLRALAGEQ
jgi:hypothetical protein